MVGRYSHVGFLMAVLCVGGFFLGRWIDEKIGTFPVFAIILFMLGFVLWFYRFILMLQEDKRSKTGPPPP